MYSYVFMIPFCGGLMISPMEWLRLPDERPDVWIFFFEFVCLLLDILLYTWCNLIVNDVFLIFWNLFFSRKS